MSSFHEAYDTVMSHEGGYVNDPIDRGGETYKGISRVNWPDWEGWGTIDKHKSLSVFPRCLYDNLKLESLVRKFYKKRFFAPYKGENMPEALAVEMFDISVNMGVRRAILFLQTALNALNRDKELYQDLKVDGAYGDSTATALALFRAKEGCTAENLLVKVLNILQGAHYLKIMKDDPSQERFARGWLKRVEILKCD